MDWLEKAISKQCNYIEDFLIDPLSQLAVICADNWSDRSGLDRCLFEFLSQRKDHRCNRLYAIDDNGLQYSSNVSDALIDEAVIGQNLVTRPYLEAVDKSDKKDFILSEVYVDKRTHMPCITALYRVTRDDVILGFIAADFDLKRLPLKNVNEKQLPVWRQIKGDPSIRATLFQQTRSYSAMDEHIDEVLDVVESLMSEQGVFHAKLHFSSSRATLWHYHDPYHYRLHVLDEIINPKVCLAYEQIPYPLEASTAVSQIPEVFKVFKALRESDDVIYLRAASLNIMNGLVGLNFSCDGSHYMPVDEFLKKDLRFWFGEEQQGAACNA